MIYLKTLTSTMIMKIKKWMKNGIVMVRMVRLRVL